MARPKRDSKREERIAEEIVVDANGPEEQAMGWYYYLEEKLGFPFLATCIGERAVSPLRKGEKVEVVAMAPERECGHEMFVAVRWEGRQLAVPLSQLKPAAKADEDTKEAVADWHYWVAQGYEL
jgi:hypothetical protein